MWEFGNVTLRCSCPKNSLNISTFYRGNKNDKCVDLILFQNKTCYMRHKCRQFEDFKCTDNITFDLTIKLLRQENGYNWSCSCGLVTVIKSDQVVIYVDVPVVNTNLLVDNSNISEDTLIQTMNSSSLALKCSASCARPEPMITWYKPANSTGILSNSTTYSNGLFCSHSTLYYKPRLETQNHQVYCSASNKENEHHKSSKITIEVLYPPRAGQMLNTSTIEGKNFEIMCNGTRGKPNQTEYIWSNRNNASISKEINLNIRNVSRTDQTYYTCTMRNTMKPTYGPSVEGISSARFYLTVQSSIYKLKEKETTNSSNTGLLVGVGVTASVTTLAFVAVAFIGYKRFKKMRRPSANDSPRSGVISGVHVSSTYTDLDTSRIERNEYDGFNAHSTSPYEQLNTSTQEKTTHMELKSTNVTNTDTTDYVNIRI